jgi:DNA-binding CsgD family transcriptional regulator
MRRHQVGLLGTDAVQLGGRRYELSVLGRLIDAVRAGESRVLVMHGEPGVGKTALLDHLVGQASGCQVAWAAGVQSEMELAFGGLHQLCAPMLDRLEHLPVPQLEALQTAFGVSTGQAPDRFMVGLAVLNLLADAAAERPLVCLIDDQQWLDRTSAQVLGFVARRLAAQPVGLVFAATVPGEELAGLPELAVEGLREDDARALLDAALTGSLDARVRDQIVAETRGNPLALLELPRGMTPEELAGGFGLPRAVPVPGRIEESFRRRIGALPADARRLLQLAAADPLGDPLLVWRAAERLGIPVQAAVPAAEAGLLEFGAQVRFRHPLVRSAAYQSASLQERREVHGALAEVTDPGVDPDRRAWHRAQAAPGPDEDVASELVRSAGRAQRRGGLAAAAAFLERAALLTPEPGHRVQRLFAAAGAKRDAGAPDAALGLLVAVEAGPLDELQAAEAEHLRGQIALDSPGGSDAARLLRSAARRFEPVDVGLARETHLEALLAELLPGGPETPAGLRAAAGIALTAPAGASPPRAVDLLLDGLALRFTQGYAAAAPVLSRALELLLELNVSSAEASRWLQLAGGRASGIVAMELWDFESWRALATRQVQVARETGALVYLQFALSCLAKMHLLAGDLAAAARLIEEDHQIAAASGNPPMVYSAMLLAAWRGQEAEASRLIETTTQAAAARGSGMLANFAACAGTLLYNGLGQPDAAYDAARRAFEHDSAGFGTFGSLVVPEVAEAAARIGDVALVKTALEWLTERTRVTPTGWVLGIEARIRALISDGEAADRGYRESIGHLGQTRVRAELARSHLLYGEWLRRQGRRGDAREQLRTAYEMLDAMGIRAFAERARGELLAIGETARKRTAQPAGSRQGQADEPLTAQEAQVARLARDGLSNPQIGARLFISARTVQYHLGKVFTKLHISSRSQLEQALPADLDAVTYAQAR